MPSTSPSQILLGTTDTGQPLRLDLPRLINSRLLIQANSGGGKSWLFRLIAEQAGQKLPLVILDPEGEFASIRERLDVILVGQDGEIPAEPRTAASLARKLVEHQVSAVIDLFDLDWDQRRLYVRLFLESLMALPRTLWRPGLLMIDEAQKFAPERGHGEAESTGAIVSLMAQGRKRGLCGLLATQRLSVLHKDAAAEANNVFIGRTWLDTDQKRAGDLLGFAARDRAQLRDVPEGTFFTFGPALSITGITRFRTGPVSTTHPQPGQHHLLTPPKASISITQLARQLANLPHTEIPTTQTLQAAHRRIRELETALHTHPKPGPASAIIKEVPVLSPTDLATLKHLFHRAETAAAETRQLGADLSSHCTTLQARLTGISAPSRSLPPSPTPGETTQSPIQQTSVSQRRPTPFAPTHARGPQGLPEGERRILTAIGQYPDGVRRQQLSLLTQYKRSSRDAFIQRLKTKGLVSLHPKGVMITAAGRATLGPDYQPLPVGHALQEYWLTFLPEGERRVLQVLLDRYPQSVDRDTIDAATGYKRSSRDAFLQRLGTRELITINPDGSIQASNELWDQGPHQ